MNKKQEKYERTCSTKVDPMLAKYSSPLSVTSVFTRSAAELKAFGEKIIYKQINIKKEFQRVYDQHVLLKKEIVYYNHDLQQNSKKWQQV